MKRCFSGRRLTEHIYIQSYRGGGGGVLEKKIKGQPQDFKFSCMTKICILALLPGETQSKAFFKSNIFIIK